jgi:phage terminase small subunit
MIVGPVSARRATMSLMARPRKPPGLRLLESSGDGKDKRGERVPTVANLPRVAPDPPPQVKENPLAMAERERVLPILTRARLLHEGSQSALAAYCLASAEAMEAHRRYALGEISYRELGIDRAHRAWAGQMGLTPSSEDVLTKAAAAVPEEDDPFAWSG